MNETSLLTNLSLSLEENGSGTMSIGPGSSAAARTNSRLVSSFFRDSMRQNRPYQQPTSKLSVAKDSGKSSGNLAVSTPSTVNVNSSTEKMMQIEKNVEEQDTVLEYTSTIS